LMNPILAKWRFWQVDVAAMAAWGVMIAVVVFGGYRPLIQRHGVCEAEARELAREREELKTVQTAVSAMERKLDQLQRSLDGSFIRLDAISSLNRRLGELTALAGEMELKVDETAAGNPAATEHYCIIPVHLSGSGSYDRCTEFLHQLRLRFADIRLGRVELTGSPDGTGLFRLEVRWYAAPTTAGERVQT